MFLFTNRGEKLGKTRPRSFSQFPWDFVVLDFERLETPKLRGVGGVNQWLGCCWFHVGQIGFFSVPMNENPRLTSQEIMKITNQYLKVK